MITCSTVSLILMDRFELFRKIEGDLSKHVIEESINKFPEEVGLVRNLIDTFVGLGSLISRPSESYQRNTVFLVYLWEAWHSSRRSLIESLSGHYNAGFILLRSTLELMVKGVVYQCLSQKKFRENANFLRDKKDVYILRLDELLVNQAHLVEEFNSSAISTFDKLEKSFADYRPNVKHFLSQILQWHLLDGIEISTNDLYSDFYGRLSSDVHVMPNSTDTGRAIKSGETAFGDKHVIDEALLEYLNSVTQIIDLVMIITLNWIKENIQDRNRLQSVLIDYFKEVEVEKLSLPLFKKRYLELTT